MLSFIGDGALGNINFGPVLLLINTLGAKENFSGEYFPNGESCPVPNIGLAIF